MTTAEEFLASGPNRSRSCAVCRCPRAVELVDKLLDAWPKRSGDRSVRDILAWLKSCGASERITYDGLRNHLRRDACRGERWRNRDKQP